MGVSSQDGSLTYYLFDDAALNSFSKPLTDITLQTTQYELVGTEQIPVRKLETILRQHLPVETKIDFLTVDVEGFDLDVLRSNDWDAYRPSCVLVESLQSSLEGILDSEVFCFMRQHGYGLHAKTVNTLIFTLGE